MYFVRPRHPKYDLRCPHVFIRRYPLLPPTCRRANYSGYQPLEVCRRRSKRRLKPRRACRWRNRTEDRRATAGLMLRWLRCVCSRHRNKPAYVPLKTFFFHFQKDRSHRFATRGVVCTAGQAWPQRGGGREAYFILKKMLLCGLVCKPLTARGTHGPPDTPQPLSPLKLKFIPIISLQRVAPSTPHWRICAPTPSSRETEDGSYA